MRGNFFTSSTLIPEYRSKICSTTSNLPGSYSLPDGTPTGRGRIEQPSPTLAKSPTSYDSNILLQPTSRREHVAPSIATPPPRAAGVMILLLLTLTKDVASGRYPRHKANNSSLSLPAPVHRLWPSPFRHHGSNRSVSPPSLRDLPPLVSSSRTRNNA